MEGEFPCDQKQGLIEASFPAKISFISGIFPCDQKQGLIEAGHYEFTQQCRHGISLRSKAGSH